MLKIPESLGLYETNAINIYSEKAIKKKLKKLSRVFFIYIGIIIIFYLNFSLIKYILSNIQL